MGAGVARLVRSSRLLPLVAVLVSGVILTWSLGWWSGTSSAVDSSGTAALTLFPPGQRPLVPTLRGTTLAGKPMDLANLRGHVVVLNVWASWCAPCRAESPALSRVSKQTYARGVRFVGIDTRDNLAAARAFRAGYDITYPSFIDQRGELVLAFTQVIPVGAIPSTLVIDSTGHITARVIGAIDYSTLRGLIADTLRESSLSKPGSAGPR